MTFFHESYAYDFSEKAEIHSMILVPEVVEHIVSFLPKQTYNDLYRVNRPVGLYEVIPQQITVDGRKNKWSYTPDSPEVRFVHDIDELILFHTSPPFYPTDGTITLCFRFANVFMQAHVRVPELLLHYNISIDLPISNKVPNDLPYTISYCNLVLTDLSDSTTELEIRGVSKVGSISSESVNSVRIECEPHESVQDLAEKGSNSLGLGDINKWEVPKLAHLEVIDIGKRGSQLFRNFQHLGALQELKLDQIYTEDIPDLSSFTLKKLTVSINESQDVNLKLPQALESLDVSGYNGDVNLSADFEFPKRLNTLSLKRVSTSSQLPKSLTSLTIIRCIWNEDFSSFTSLKSLKYHDLALREVQLPLSLEDLNLQVANTNLGNLLDLQQLKHLHLSYPGSNHLQLSPNLTSCKIYTSNEIHTLILNDTLRHFTCASEVGTPIIFPETIQSLTMFQYNHSLLHLPEGLEFLELLRYYLRLKAPKNLKYLSIRNNELLTPNWRLNLLLKTLELKCFEVDVRNDIFTPKLDYLMLYDCDFNLDDVDMDEKYVPIYEEINYHTFARRIF